MNRRPLPRPATLVFYWWDDARDAAQRRAAATGRRHRVRGFRGRWLVSEVGA